MLSAARPLLDEYGGRAAQVLDPWNRWLASFAPVAAAVRGAWTAETAWIDDWDCRSPARGQCGTSTLIFQDQHGGELVRGLVHETGRSAAPTVHYWNVLGDRHVDLTWQQFSSTAFVLRSERVRRAELLANDWFIHRYRVLRERVDARLHAGVDQGALGVRAT
jgi:hypothetical protein